MTQPDTETANRHSNFARNYLGIGMMRMLSFPASLVSSIILARVLGPDGFGQYAFVMALIPLFALPVDAGLPRFITREVAATTHSGLWGRFRGLQRFGLYWIAGYTFLLILIASVLFAIRSFDLPDSDTSRLLFIAVFLVPLLGLMNFYTGITKGLGFVTVSELPPQVIRPLAFVLFLVIAESFGRLSPDVAIVGQISAAVAALFAANMLLRARRPGNLQMHDTTYAVKEWTSVLLPISLIALVGTLNAQVGIIMLGFMDTDQSVAALRIAESGARMVGIPLVIVNLVIGPQIVRYRADRDTGKLQHLSRLSARWALVFAAPLAIAFFGFGEELIRLAFGAPYAASALWPLVVLAAGTLTSVFFGSVGYLLTMSGFERDTLSGQILALTVNVIGCAILIPHFGALGAAMGVSIGIVTWNVLLAVRVRQRLGIWPSAF